MGAATDGVRAEGHGAALVGKWVTTTLAKPTYGSGTPPSTADDEAEEDEDDEEEEEEAMDVETAKSDAGAAGAGTNTDAAVGNELTCTMLTCV